MTDGEAVPAADEEAVSAAGDAGWEELAAAASQAVTRAASRAGTGLAARLDTDPDTVERDLMKLVLTLVELLRQLMERSALHRVDKGDLSEEQEERIGRTLMVLHDRMRELCAQQGLTMADLNLDLGPLGSLLPYDE
jgi:hypothetical protein